MLPVDQGAGLAGAGDAGLADGGVAGHGPEHRGEQRRGQATDRSHRPRGNGVAEPTHETKAEVSRSRDGRRLGDAITVSASIRRGEILGLEGTNSGN